MTVRLLESTPYADTSDAVDDGGRGNRREAEGNPKSHDAAI